MKNKNLQILLSSLSISGFFAYLSSISDSTFLCAWNVSVSVVSFVIMFISVFFFLEDYTK